jgi:high frequency lysogenization protein
MKTDRDRCIALAGVYQAVDQVASIARTGRFDAAALEASIYSLFQIDAAGVAEVYGGVVGVSLGIARLQVQLQGSDRKNVEVTRYLIALLHLERKLAGRDDLTRRIGEGLHIAQARLEHFPLTHDNILGQLADLYADTISTLPPRILVQGEPLHLQDPANVHRIRALLLAGIRSARLWTQCGGSRLRILFGRGGLLREAAALTADQA